MELYSRLVQIQAREEFSSIKPCHLYHIKTNAFLLHIGMSPRSGTDADAASVREVFMKLGYKIKINNDLSCGDIVKILKNGKR